MDAEAVAFHIKQRFPTMLVILLSAFADLPERVLWLVDDYVMKSEPLEGVAEVVKRVISPAKKVPVRSEELLQQRQAAG